MTADAALKYRLISADDHVDLSHDAVKEHLATKHHQAYDDAVAGFRAAMAARATSAANTRWREQRGVAGAVKGMQDRSYAAWGRVGHRDAAARLADMDTDGVEASVTYCEVSAFRYLYQVQGATREATEAFNSALHQWASPAPDRLVVNFQIPIHDIDVAVSEVRRAASLGVKSLQLPVFPVELDLPDYWDERYDPLFTVIQETGLPICLHIGFNTQLEALAQRDPTPQRGIFVPMVALSTAEALGMWVLGGVFERFPDLRVVFVEPGIGWVAWWLYTVDDLNLRQDYEFPALRELPSVYFRRNVFLTFVDEPDVVRHADRVGIHNVLWSSDYPHPVTSWPTSQGIADRLFGDVPAAERDLILHGNALRVWNL
jgi:predicted TIM-barrel fold metal-dependent hydrolase